MNFVKKLLYKVMKMDKNDCIREVIIDARNIIVQEDFSNILESCSEINKRFGSYLTKKDMNKKPIVVEINGHYVALDGNKRVTAGRVNKEKLNVILLSPTKECFTVLPTILDLNENDSALLTNNGYKDFIKNHIFVSAPYKKDYFISEINCKHFCKKMKKCLNKDIDEDILKYKLGV